MHLVVSATVATGSAIVMLNNVARSAGGGEGSSSLTEYLGCLDFCSKALP